MKLNRAFRKWQNAVESKDKNKLNELISDTFQSNARASKTAYIHTLLDEKLQLTFPNQDISLKGLEEGDKAYIRTLEFNQKSYYLVFTLMQGEWKITNMDVLE